MSATMHGRFWRPCGLRPFTGAAWRRVHHSLVGVYDAGIPLPDDVEAFLKPKKVYGRLDVLCGRFQDSLGYPRWFCHRMYKIGPLYASVAHITGERK